MFENLDLELSISFDHLLQFLEDEFCTLCKFKKDFLSSLSCDKRNFLDGEIYEVECLINSLKGKSDEIRGISDGL